MLSHGQMFMAQRGSANSPFDDAHGSRVAIDDPRVSRSRLQLPCALDKAKSNAIWTWWLVV